MSDDKKDAKKDGKKDGGGGMPFSLKLSVFMLMVTAVIFLPTTIVFAVCMIPTMVAAIVDNNQKRTLWLTVGAMNTAGTVPVWFSLVDGGHTLATAFRLVIEPSSIVIAFGGAAVGWGIYYYITPLIASVIQGKNERRLREIDKIQKGLVRKWGEAVILK